MQFEGYKRPKGPHPCWVFFDNIKTNWAWDTRRRMSMPLDHAYTFAMADKLNLFAAYEITTWYGEKEKKRPYIRYIKVGKVKYTRDEFLDMYENLRGAFQAQPILSNTIFEGDFEHVKIRKTK